MEGHRKQRRAKPFSSEPFGFDSLFEGENQGKSDCHQSRISYNNNINNNNKNSNKVLQAPEALGSELEAETEKVEQVPPPYYKVVSNDFVGLKPSTSVTQSKNNIIFPNCESGYQVHHPGMYAPRLHNNNGNSSGNCSVSGLGKPVNNQSFQQDISSGTRFEDEHLKQTSLYHGDQHPSILNSIYRTNPCSFDTYTLPESNFEKSPKFSTTLTPAAPGKMASAIGQSLNQMSFRTGASINNCSNNINVNIINNNSNSNSVSKQPFVKNSLGNHNNNNNNNFGTDAMTFLHRSTTENSSDIAKKDVIDFISDMNKMAEGVEAMSQKALWTGNNDQPLSVYEVKVADQATKNNVKSYQTVEESPKEESKSEEESGEDSSNNGTNNVSTNGSSEQQFIDEITLDQNDLIAHMDKTFPIHHFETEPMAVVNGLNIQKQGDVTIDCNNNNLKRKVRSISPKEDSRARKKAQEIAGDSNQSSNTSSNSSFVPQSSDSCSSSSTYDTRYNHQKKDQKAFSKRKSSSRNSTANASNNDNRGNNELSGISSNVYSKKDLVDQQQQKLKQQSNHEIHQQNHNHNHNHNQNHNHNHNQNQNQNHNHHHIHNQEQDQFQRVRAFNKSDFLKEKFLRSSSDSMNNSGTSGSNSSGSGSGSRGKDSGITSLISSRGSSSILRDQEEKNEDICNFLEYHYNHNNATRPVSSLENKDYLMSDIARDIKEVGQSRFLSHPPYDGDKQSMKTITGLGKESYPTLGKESYPTLGKESYPTSSINLDVNSYFHHENENNSNGSKKASCEHGNEGIDLYGAVLQSRQPDNNSASNFGGNHSDSNHGMGSGSESYTGSNSKADPIELRRERNRIAAKKSREKRAQFLNELQGMTKHMESDNFMLRQQLQLVSRENALLKNFVKDNAKYIPPSALTSYIRLQRSLDQEWERLSQSSEYNVNNNNNNVGSSSGNGNSNGNGGGNSIGNGEEKSNSLSRKSRESSTNTNTNSSSNTSQNSTSFSSTSTSSSSGSQSQNRKSNAVKPFSSFPGGLPTTNFEYKPSMDTTGNHETYPQSSRNGLDATSGLNGRYAGISSKNYVSIGGSYSQGAMLDDTLRLSSHGNGNGNGNGTSSSGRNNRQDNNQTAYYHHYSHGNGNYSNQSA